jgi:hypothetical protein
MLLKQKSKYAIVIVKRLSACNGSQECGIGDEAVHGRYEQPVDAWGILTGDSGCDRR